MNPWITEQLGAAHRNELRRVAARNIYPDVERSGTPARTAGRRRPVRHARRTVGALLIRIGGRVGGLDAFSRPLPTA
jgi:hypothetical protein